MALTKIGKEGITGISNSANANAITVDSGENVALSGTLGVTGETTLATHLNLGDNDKIKLGAGGDLQIYHDTNHSYVEDTGTGELRLKTNGTAIRFQHGSETLSLYTEDGSVELFHNDSKKFETTSSGVTVTGNVISNDGSNNARFQFDNNNQILIQNDTAMNFYVNGNNNLKIDSNGNVGIGTASPANTLEIKSTTNSDGIRLSNAVGSYYHLVRSNGDGLLFDADAGSGGGTGADIRFQVKNTERMRINSSGNVAIGGTSASGLLHLHSSSNAFMFIQSGNSSVAGLILGDTADSAIGGIVYDNNTDKLALRGSNNADRLTIDSSGNVLVKKTATNYQTVGVEAKSTGQLWATADQNNPIIAVRKTNDGKIQTFYKDTTEAGSIGNAGARLFINSGNVGLNFAGDGSNQILPSNAGANRDDAIILGTTNVRFKDLYLSGGVFLGGTGSANKLDDYEEGTWTPTFTMSTASGFSASYNRQFGQYVKIGKLVYIRYDCQATSISGGSGASTLAGLPFSALISADGAGYGAPQMRAQTALVTAARQGPNSSYLAGNLLYYYYFNSSGTEVGATFNGSGRITGEATYITND